MELSNFRSLSLAIITAIVSFFCYQGLALLVGRPDSFFLASALTMCVISHEITHWFTFAGFRIRSHLIFGVIGAFCIPDKRDADKINQLNWWQNSFLLLAGAIGNIAFVLACLVGFKVGWISRAEMSQIYFISGNIMLFDLIIPALADGSKVMRRLLGSTSVELQPVYRIAFGSSGLLVMSWISKEGGCFPSYWGLIFILDCIVGGSLGKFTREKLWPKMEKYSITRPILRIFKQKFGEKPEDQKIGISEGERILTLLVFISLLALGSFFKYCAFILHST